jgi:DNA-binding transcriptional ArsR family regulator
MTNVSARQALAALGDPTRQAIIERVAARPRPVGEIAAGLPVSRSAVSQHLKVLKDAGLVREVADGTRRIYRLDPRGLGAIRNWLDSHWAVALDAFQAFADGRADQDSEDGTP